MIRETSPRILDTADDRHSDQPAHSISSEASGHASVGCQSPDHFVAILAHDLRAPLAAIIFTAQDELRRAGDVRRRRAAARVLSCAERMKAMTADLLDLARARMGGGLPVRPDKVDLAELAGEALKEVEDSHPGSHVRLGVEGDVQGEWDPARMVQVLVNLMCNAVQHGAGGVPVDLRVVRQPESVRIEVANRGEPIPESEIPRLFEPFARGSRSRPESVGLGLFIVSEIVAAHGGEVRAFNSPEAGTVTFAVQLPLRSAARE
jgi:signal transduction histidine kinase